eukprot:CAMPEP_0174881934 /NCGR_PEP_ID=MMETSP1114-20130205/84510_1 /TAXON_ID=312471 /ORGANISM="Neobodo designis, Strain CCAP 1951/1" /LENGTH=219 /DNA_ID=CAMNT_0016117331 /DNA_START=56 /DNA_END=715 /DNA_ORIENTATION=+
MGCASSADAVDAPSSSLPPPGARIRALRLEEGVELAVTSAPLDAFEPERRDHTAWARRTVERQLLARRRARAEEAEERRQRAALLAVAAAAMPSAALFDDGGTEGSPHIPSDADAGEDSTRRGANLYDAVAPGSAATSHDNDDGDFPVGDPNPSIVFDPTVSRDSYGSHTGSPVSTRARNSSAFGLSAGNSTIRLTSRTSRTASSATARVPSTLLTASS